MLALLLLLLVLLSVTDDADSGEGFEVELFEEWKLLGIVLAFSADSRFIVLSAISISAFVTRFIDCSRSLITKAKGSRDRISIGMMTS